MVYLLLVWEMVRSGIDLYVINLFGVILFFLKYLSLNPTLCLGNVFVARSSGHAAIHMNSHSQKAENLLQLTR